MAHAGLPDAGHLIPPRPALASKARLRYDRTSGGYLLLYPERGLALNPTAASIVQLCKGELTVEGIVERLQREYADRPAPELRQDVLGFLEEMARRGLLVEGG
jgi:coenzyme PQQ biosynthesis protein PqqD